MEEKRREVFMIWILTFIKPNIRKIIIHEIP